MNRSIFLAVALAAVSGAAMAAPNERAAKLTFLTEPQGAVVLVVPADPKAKSFQCVTPCSVRIPQNWGLKIFASKPGYVMDSANVPPLKWVRTGLFRSELASDTMVIPLKPVADSGL